MAATILRNPASTRPVVVGHRGSPQRARENTPAAFSLAAAEGAEWVELDARRAKDGAVLVHHDPALADGRALVELTAAEAQAAGVHLLADVLAGLPDGLGVDLEIKNFPTDPDFDEDNAVVRACVELVAAARPRPLFTSSFNPAVLLAWQEAGGVAPVGLLTFGLDLDAAVEEAQDLEAALLCPHVDSDGLDPAGVAAAQQAGLEVMVWTVDDLDRAAELAAAGVDGLCTNDPAGVVARLDATAA